MITASHNPVTDNGFKLVKDNLSLSEPELREMMIGNIAYTKNKKQVSSIHKNITKEYIDDLMLDYSYKRRLKILWDPGNCTVANIIHDVTKSMPEHTQLIILFLSMRVLTQHNPA